MTDLIKSELDPSPADTLRRLGALEDGLQVKALRFANRVAAKPLRAAMARNAPDDPSTSGSRIARALNITLAKKGAAVRTGVGGRVVAVKTGEVALIVGPNKKLKGEKYPKVDWLAWILEKGAKSHTIKPRTNGPGRLSVGDGVIGGSVEHPGLRGAGWMDNAFQQAGGAVEEQFFQGLDKWITKNAN